VLVFSILYVISTSSAMNSLNKDTLEDLMHQAEDLGACGINFAGTIPDEKNQHLVISDADSLELYQQIQELRKDAEIEVHTTSCLYTSGGIHFYGVLNLDRISFNPRGELVFC
jgi:MoaA/NifB/PqqE/SkfB family radical SAM enzyme